MPVSQTTADQQTPGLAAILKKIPLKNRSLLRRALIHRSWLNEHPQVRASSNERLEFLGDAVLELIVSEYLYRKFPKKPEGELTSLRASLVRTETLANLATNLGLGKALRLSKGEEQGGGRENPSLLANTFEALIGAIYVSEGMEEATRFVHRHLTPKLSEIITNKLDRDPKSLLQELVQAQGAPAPIYRVEKEEGPDHDKRFTVSVFIKGVQVAIGTGKSKQQAQQAAARAMLENQKSI